MTGGGNQQVDLYQIPGNPNVLAPLPESCSTGIKNAEFITAATPAQAVHDEESPLITYLPKTKIFQRFWQPGCSWELQHWLGQIANFSWEISARES